MMEYNKPVLSNIIKTLFILLLFTLTIGCNESSKAWTSQDKYKICKAYISSVMAYPVSSFTSVSQTEDSTIIKDRNGESYNCLIDKKFILWQTYFPDSVGWGRIRYEDEGKLSFNFNENTVRINTPNRSTKSVVLGSRPKEKNKIDPTTTALASLPECNDKSVENYIFEEYLEKSIEDLTESYSEFFTEFRVENFTAEEVSHDPLKHIKLCKVSYDITGYGDKVASLSDHLTYELRWSEKPNNLILNVTGSDLVKSKQSN